MSEVLGNMTKVDAGRHPIVMGTGSLAALDASLGELGTGVRIFILCDENTLRHCLPELQRNLPRLIDAEVLSVPAGEGSKSLNCCRDLWQELASHGADRNALLIALGGGVVTDLGGFVAGTYKRSIRSINIPTTLMGMVDAAIGSKTGIDLGGTKNIVGLLHDPLAVYVHVPFLRTLGKRELLNGIAEMMKHALIADRDHWEEIKGAALHDMAALTALIERSATIKAGIVKSDPEERDQRKLLNFGHTIGHAVEAHSWESEHQSLLHGEAIAMGMICASWLSWRLGMLDRAAHEEITDRLMTMYPVYPIDSTGHHRLLELMRNDKKNVEGQFRFTLLSAIGEGQVDVRVTAAQVQEALEHYRALVQMNGRHSI